MTKYGQDEFVRDGSEELRTSVLAEACPVGFILNRIDDTIVDATDRSLAIYIADFDYSTAFNGSGSVNDRYWQATPGQDVICKVAATGSVSEGDRLIADQTALGRASASTTADDIANYGIGVALTDKGSDGGVWVDLSSK